MLKIIISVSKIVITAIILFFGTIVNAQKLDDSLLWKISGNGLEKPSYLYGTMHAVCETNIDDEVMTAFDETEQLFLEIDMDDPQMQMKMMKGMMMTEGTTMTSLLSEDDAAKLDAFLKDNLGYSLAMFDKFKPFMLTSLFLPKLLDCPFVAVDNELMKISKEQNEEIYGLETIEDQMMVFDKVPYQAQMDEVMRVVNSGLDKEKEELKKMMSTYKTENIEAMLALSDESESKMMRDFEEDILLKRNRNWIPVMEKTMQEKPTFFGVGAAHLAGEEGVINLLRKKGFTVEAVN